MTTSEKTFCPQGIVPTVVYGAQSWFHSICWLPYLEVRKQWPQGHVSFWEPEGPCSQHTSLSHLYRSSGRFSLGCPQWHCSRHLLTERSPFLGHPNRDPKDGLTMPQDAVVNGRDAQHSQREGEIRKPVRRGASSPRGLGGVCLL